MRKYLLGTLGGPEARAIEERYFADPAFLRFVQSVEDALIQDYVDARLTAADRRRFEQRYLAVDELRRKVEARERSARPARPLAYTFAAACLLLAIAAVWLQRNAAAPAPLRLRPGLLMSGADSEFEWDLAKGNARLVLLAPGAAVVPTAISVSALGADRSASVVWSTSDLRPKQVDGFIEYAVEVPAAVLREGDYLVRLSGSNGDTLENYALRVRGSR